MKAQPCGPTTETTATTGSTSSSTTRKGGIRITADRAALIDEAGRLKLKLAASDAEHQAVTATDRVRLASLRAAFPEWVGTEPADKALALEGERFIVSLSERGNQSHVRSLTKVYRRLGRLEFFKHAEIGLGVLRALLPKHEHDTFIATERTGPRAVKIVRKAS